MQKVIIATLIVNLVPIAGMAAAVETRGSHTAGANFIGVPAVELSAMGLGLPDQPVSIGNIGVPENLGIESVDASLPSRQPGGVLHQVGTALPSVGPVRGVLGSRREVPISISPSPFIDGSDRKPTDASLGYVFNSQDGRVMTAGDALNSMAHLVDAKQAAKIGAGFDAAADRDGAVPVAAKTPAQHGGTLVKEGKSLVLRTADGDIVLPATRSGDGWELYFPGGESRRVYDSAVGKGQAVTVTGHYKDDEFVVSAFSWGQ